MVVRRGNEKVYVECKSIKDYSAEQDRLIRELGNRVSGRLRKLKRHWHVKIRTKRRLYGNSLNAISLEIENKAYANDLSDSYIQDSDTSIAFKKIAEPDQLVPGSFEVPLDGEYGTASAEVILDDFGIQYYSNPTTIEVETDVKYDYLPSIRGDIRNASQKIPDGESAIVHIQIELRDAKKITKIADAVFEDVRALIERDHKRINAVVLCGASIRNNSKPDENLINFEFVIIPNKEAHHPLPPWFEIIGSYPDVMLDGLGEEGELEFRLRTNIPMSMQRGRYLQRRISGHGLRQFQIWQSFSDVLRFEIFHPNLGRLVRSYDFSQVADGADHIVKFAWSGGNAVVYLDGEQLEEDASSQRATLASFTRNDIPDFTRR